MPLLEFGLFVFVFALQTLPSYGELVNGKSATAYRDHKHDKRLANKMTAQHSRNSTDYFASSNDLQEFRVVQSNLLRITSPSLRRPKRDTDESGDTTERGHDQDDREVTTTEVIVHALLNETDQRDEGRAVGSNKLLKHGGGGNKKKKKKKKGGLYSIFKKMKHYMPKFMEKMHGPSMFMLGMAQANFHNFVMHALMMSKMALISVIMMIIREAVFGDKDEPVKYYNFGYDHPSPHKRIIDSYDYPSYYEYKRRRKRQS